MNPNVPPSPGMPSEHVRNIAVDIVLTFVLCGLWNIYVQAKQMDAVNAMIKQQKYAFWPWLGLSLITCGIWHIYHEFRMSTDIAQVMGKPKDSNDPVVALVLSIIGLSIVVDAIQQTEINRYYGSNAL